MIESAITNTISLIDTELVHDVLFIVDSSPERPLFGSKSALSAACPYFKVMFESGFKESKSIEDYAGASEDEEEPYIAGSILKLVDEASQELRLARYFSADGSDEDTPISKKRKLLAGQDEEAASHYTRILIEDTTYEAFRALLVYLATGDIYFEPLLSQIGQEAFDSFHAKYEIDHPDKPKPVSPLSMYRLAHRYELDDLRARCLVQLNRSLVDSKLVREAFSEECFLYTEIKDVVHKRMASSWLSIQKSKEWIDTMKQIEAGALPYSSTLLASFMLRKASEPAQTGFQRRYY
ncbi:hypothetical protein BCR35DRAFT_311845 [Leucosporidium creatinivorum]|uniref:BTB domain-containing protein n=1 Tax=Leucosporidium creatinivorum TaxID=106004 RepID=A0A1Y2G8S7_9BASI|nr:hypothetical protein BCR35DRAFT_311845 [Leucosporidium creatinivorum]